jgi:hypothetical protein
MKITSRRVSASGIVLISTRCHAGIENPRLIKLPIGFGPHRIENTPVIYEGRPLLIENTRLTNETDASHPVETYVVDLTTTEVICRFGETFAYPMLEPDEEDGINATDSDLFEFGGQTYLFYGPGWQDSRGTIRVKMYPSTMKECLESYFSDDVPMIRFDARQERYLYPE